MSRNIPIFHLLSFVILCASGLLASGQSKNADAESDAQGWAGTWSGSVTSRSSTNNELVSNSFTITIARADMGKIWTVRGNSITKEENLPGIKSVTTLTRTGVNTCTYQATGIASGRGGYTKRVSGELSRADN